MRVIWHNVWVVTFLLLMCPQEAVSQRSDLQEWTLLTTQVSLDNEKKWLLYGEIQPRVGDNISRLERLLVRPAIGYNVSESVTAYVGYAWTPTFVDTEYHRFFRDEHRTWQQILFKHSAIGLAWQHRFREEQRFIENASGVSNRFRYLARGSYRVGQSLDWGVTGYNELFVTFNSVEQGPRAGFDRNRFFYGPYLSSGSARYEVGYLGEYGKRFGSNDRMINAIFAGATFNF